VAGAGELVSGAHADHAGTEDEDFHCAQPALSGAAPAAVFADGSSRGGDRCVIRVRHHWAVRAILHAPFQENPMVAVIAGLAAPLPHRAVAA